MSGNAIVAYFFGCFFLMALTYHGELRKVQYFMTSGAKYFVFTMCLLSILTAASLVAEVWSMR